MRALAWITAGHELHHRGLFEERYGISLADNSVRTDVPARAAALVTIDDDDATFDTTPIVIPAAGSGAFATAPATNATSAAVATLREGLSRNGCVLVRNLVGFYEAGELVGIDDFPNVTRVLDVFLARPAVGRGLTIPGPEHAAAG